MGRIGEAVVAAGILLGSAGTASADVIFELSNVVLSDGTSLTGTFSYNDALTTRTAANIVAATTATFAGLDYIYGVNAGGPSTGYFFQLNSGSDSIQIAFASPIKLTGETPSSSTYECENGSNCRSFVSGTVIPFSAAVPEPAPWSLLGIALAALGVLRTFDGRSRRGATAE